eukprot:779480-Amorphochlora_amoeboformis.AAC.1
MGSVGSVAAWVPGLIGFRCSGAAWVPGLLGIRNCLGSGVSIIKAHPILTAAWVPGLLGFRGGLGSGA